MDRYRQIETFVRVVEAGSYVRAATVLGTSKAAVSRGVLELEARLGARLLHRTTRHVAPTEAGRAYYERARNLLAELAEADAAAASRAPSAAGLLRVNAPHTFGVRHLAPLLGPFLDGHPDIELDLTLTDRRVDLGEENVDLAIRITHAPDPALMARKLAAVRLVACASPQYLARHGLPQRPADLAHHRTIGYNYAPAGDVWTFTGESGSVAVTLSPHVHANDGEVCRAAALAHQGIVLQPTFVVADALAAGSLVQVLADHRGEELGVYAVYPPRRQPAARVRVFVDFLAQAFASADWAAPAQAGSTLMPGMRRPRRR